MATQARSSQPSLAVAGWTAVAAVVLAGAVLSPLASSYPSQEPSPLVTIYEETNESGERFDDQFREYVMQDGKPVLTRLRVSLWSSTFVPRSNELQQLQELTLISPSLAKLSDWFGQLESPLQHLETLSVHIRSTGDETAPVADLMSDTLETISQKAPAIVSLKLESFGVSDATSGCPAPRVGDHFPELKQLVCVGFDCRDRVREMIGRAELESLAIFDPGWPDHIYRNTPVRSLTSGDLAAIGTLKNLNHLGLIWCVHSASEIRRLVRHTRLPELELCCKDVDSLAGFESVETLRFGYCQIDRTALADITRLTNLHTLVFHNCFSEFNVPFAPPISLRRLTVRYPIPSGGMSWIIQNSTFQNIDISLQVFLPLDAHEVSKLKNVSHLEVTCPDGQGREFVEAVTKLDRLRSLKCSINAETLDLLPQLFRMKSLENLDLRCEYDQRVDPAVWKTVFDRIAGEKPPNLSEISLRTYDDRFGKNYAPLLTLIPGLRTVTIEGPVLSGNDLAPLRACRDLRSLNLVECDFEDGVEEGLATLPYLENVRVDDCRILGEKSFDGNRRLHLEEFQLILEPSFDVSHVTADRFLIGRRWSERDRRSLWLFETEVE